MKKIFAITVHRMTNPLIFLVDYISSFENNLIFIHIDKKSDETIFFENLARDNVIFLENRVDVRWGGVGQIRATLNLMMAALKNEFDYLFFLSGDDIPLKTNKEFDYFLEKNNGKNFFQFDENGSNHIDRLKFNYPDFFLRKNKSFFEKLILFFFPIVRGVFFKNKIFHQKGKKILYYKGDSWFGIDFISANKIIEFLNSNPWYLDMYEKSYCGDEIFFHTIAKNLELNFFEESSRNNALRYIDWSSGPDYPRILDEEDVAEMKKSDMFFARKIDPNADLDFMIQFVRERS